MAGSDKTVKVTLTAEVAGFTKGMARAGQATGKLAKDADSATGGVQKLGKGMDDAKPGRFASTMGDAKRELGGMVAIGGGVAALATVNFLKNSVAAAGDLEQSIGGVDSVFRDTAGRIHAFGETSAEAVGLSHNAFNELITVTGALLKNKGLEDFTDKSLDLVKVGADLAATFGGSTKQAVEALNAAMRGESDPIERYGISLNETAVNAELAAQGLDKLEGAALEQAKAQARIDIVMRQSADAMGQFAREADTFQGQQQRLNAKWEDAQATLGAALLPALTKVVEAMSVGVDVAVAAFHAWGQIPGPIKAAVAAIVALRLAHGPLASVMSGARGAISGFGEAVGFAAQSARHAGGGFVGLSAGLRTFTGSAGLARGAMTGLRAAGSGLLGIFGGPLGLAVAGVAAALGGYIQAQQNARQAAEDFGDTLDEITGKFTEQSRTLAQQKFFKDFAQTDYSKVSKSLEDAGVSLGHLIAAYEQGGPAVDAFKAKFDAWRLSQEALDLRRQGVDIEALGNSYAALGRDMEAGAEIAKVNARAQAQVEKATGGVAAATDGATRAAKDQKPAILGVVEATQAMAKEALAADEASRKLASAMLAVTSAARGADEAEAAYQAALAKATTEAVRNRAAIDQKTGSFKLNTEAGRTNSGILVDLSAKAEANARAQLENGAAVDVVKGKMAQQREEFVQLGIKMGLSREAAGRLATQYGLTGETVEALSAEMGDVPREVKSKVTVDTSQAFQAVGAVNKLLGSIKDVTVKMFAQQAGGGWGGGVPGGGQGGGKSPVGRAPSFPWGRYPSGGVHRAYDYAVPTGTPVRSPFSGHVIAAGWDSGGFGLHVRTADSDGNFSIFGHLSRLGVTLGQAIAKGHLLGWSGDTGRSTGSHLHYERRRLPHAPGTAFRPYAAGGLVAGDAKDGHVAQHARAGAWRVWAEDETGGESYIPHANDWRRPRARKILEETAGILGARGVLWNDAGAAYRASTRAVAASGSFAGLEVTGTLDTPFGPSHIRGVVKSELAQVARGARLQGVRA